MMILLTGGSGCGKSHYAEKICASISGPLYYLAAMQPYGEEGAKRITRHRAMRQDKGFVTIERYTDYAHLTLPSRGTALLECICNLTANEMFDENGTMTDPIEQVLAGVAHLKKQCDTLVVVTNDVGSDAISYDEGTNAYVKAMGTINAILAQEADTVCELCCGIPILLKGELPI